MRKQWFLLLATSMLEAGCTSSSPAPEETPGATEPSVPDAPPGGLPVVLGCATFATAPDHWPGYSPKGEWKPLVDTALADYKRIGYDWRRYYLREYVAGGDYLNYASTFTFERLTPGITLGGYRLGPDGVPMYKPEGASDYFYDAVVVSSFALSLHSLHMQGWSLDPRFFAAARRLRAIQSDDGAYRYPFAAGFLPPGWTSSMAQAQAMSVYARAYALDHDPDWLVGGATALSFLMRLVADGGDTDSLAALDPSLSNYLVLEEYPERVPSYTLNGFGFTILGLYDWWQLAPGEASGSHADAGHAFACSIHTFASMLPYYDVGGVSAYDMNHVIKGLQPRLWVHYHEIHLGLLRALSTLAPDERALTATMSTWAGYVGQPVPTPPPTYAAPKRPAQGTTCRAPVERSAPRLVRRSGTCAGLPDRVIAPNPDCPHWIERSDDGCTETFAMTCYGPILTTGDYSIATGTVVWTTDGSCAAGMVELVLRDHSGGFVCSDAYAIEYAKAGADPAACP